MAVDVTTLALAQKYARKLLDDKQGIVDESVIQKIVDEYLAANPPKVTETDPTVPAWAKEPQKPTYTADEVGALPDTYTPPNQTAQQVGADPAGTAEFAVSQHNTDTTAHNDLRLSLQGLSDRINAALDSDDTTLDQMSEVVAYIKSNKSLIDAITTSKVSVTDIVNDLVTNVTDKPLSAAQGVALKQLIDDLQAMIPETYTLPIATETTLGGVKPVTATEAMTQPVGVTEDGRLVTKPVEGGSGIAVTGATVGQTVRIAAVDENGVPTAWEPVDLPSGEAETWELIRSVTIPDGAEEANVLTISTDSDGFPFSLKKAKIFGHFPAYTGESSIPSFSFFELNGIVSGNLSPYCYTSGWVTLNKSIARNCSIDVDLSLPGFQCEKVFMNDNAKEFFGDKRIDSITSIGGSSMLIYPGCRFVLYGVRA